MNKIYGFVRQTDSEISELSFVLRSAGSHLGNTSTQRFFGFPF